MSGKDGPTQVDAVLKLIDQLPPSSLHPPNLVVFMRDGVVQTCRALSSRLPKTTIHILGVRRDLTDREYSNLPANATYVYAHSLRARLDYLMRIPRPEVMIELGNKKRNHKASCYRHCFYFVEPGGLYMIGELDACREYRYDDGTRENLLDLLEDVSIVHSVRGRANRKPRDFVAELAAATDCIEVNSGSAIIKRSPPRQLFKLRDWEANDVLNTRYGQKWGEVVHREPGFKFEARTMIVTHGIGHIKPGRSTYDIPDRYLRQYRNATCSARQIATYGDYVLPDSFHHPHQPNLVNRQLVRSTAYFGRYLRRTSPQTTRRARGSYYYFDTEFPGHFGHFTTEVLSRVWGWELAKEIDPTVKPLVSVVHASKSLPSYQHIIFDALGISLRDALIIQPNESVEVDVLYAATPQLESQVYIDPNIESTWLKLDEGLPKQRIDNLDKIFVSRPVIGRRDCHQTAELEQFFAQQGFTIIFPETHDYLYQHAVFANARVIAGFSGSGMFNMMFAPDARVIVISGDSFPPTNEALIASVTGAEIHYFWGKSDVAMPPNGFSLGAFRSNFSFDICAYRSELEALCRLDNARGTTLGLAGRRSWTWSCRYARRLVKKWARGRD